MPVKDDNIVPPSKAKPTETRFKSFVSVVRGLAIVIYALAVLLPSEILINLYRSARNILRNFIVHIYGNQKLNSFDNYAVVKGRRVPLNELSGIDRIKRRLALTLKLPVDLFTGIIRAMLFLLHVPAKLGITAFNFMKKYADDESNSAAAVLLADTVMVIISLPFLPLHLIDKHVVSKIQKKVLEPLLNLVDSLASFVAEGIVAVAFSPITVPMYLVNKAFASSKAKEKSEVNPGPKSGAESEVNPGSNQPGPKSGAESEVNSGFNQPGPKSEATFKARSEAGESILNQFHSASAEQQSPSIDPDASVIPNEAQQQHAPTIGRKRSNSSVCSNSSV